MINPKDRAVRMVFGDAGSATLIEQGSGKIYAALQSDGSGAKDLIIPAGGFRMPSSPQTCIASEREPGNFRSDEDLYMDGMSILNFAIREVPKMIDETLNALHWDKSEVGSVVFHQANEFIVNYLAKRLKLSKDQAPIAVEGFGNTGPSSIPLLLSNCGETLSAAGRLNKAILCGFGVGLSWGVIGCDLSKTKFYKPIDY
jgi:3-oxoacyl-[acyl-carrier-protein] synthase-3